uniref:ABC transporter permease subunit n=2 Tax=Natrinema halophilum TaxID=1699371 RepID=A0A7D5KLJ5_9EURY
MVVVLGLLAVWEGYSRFLNTRGNTYFPSIEFTYRQTMANKDMIVDGILVTFSEAILAFVFAMIIGVALGVLISEVATVRQMSMPVIVFVYSFPHAILAPLFIIWFGRGTMAVGLFGAWVAFFPVFINTLTGMSQTKEEFKYLGDVIGASRWQMLRYIKIWEALPHIASSTRIAVQLSLVGVIIAEFLATGDGLGFLIVRATQRAEIGFAFGTIIVIMLVAVAFYKIVSLALDQVVSTYS